MTDLTALSTALQKAKNVVCFIHPQATYDAVAAATAFSLALEKTGRQVVVACEAPMRPEYTELNALNEVQQEVGNRDLVISFDYSEEQVDKVNYNVDETSKRFELIISPQKGGQTLDPKSVQFRQAGLSADIVVLFGFHSFDELGQYYKDEQYTIDSAFTVALTQGKISPFAKLHATLQSDGLSYSEWVYYALRQLQVNELDAAASTNILSGIEYATNRLQEVRNPRTFETVAHLMRSGAQRMPNNPALDHLGTPIRDNANGNAFAEQNSVPQSGGWQAPQMMGPNGLNNS